MSKIERIKAEIKRLIKINKTKNGFPAGTLCAYRIEAYEKLLDFIDSLPDESSEDLEKEIDNFLNDTGAPYVWCNDDEQKEWCEIIARHFYELGKQAQKEQFEKNRLAACDSLTKEEHEIESNFTSEIIEKENRTPTFIDAIKYGMRLQKDQMLIGWSEDYYEENIGTRFAFYTYKDEPFTLYLSNVFVEEASRNRGHGTQILKAAERVAETVGADTIRLKVKQDSPANAWYRKHGYEYITFEDGYDWLAKTRITQFKEG